MLQPAGCSPQMAGLEYPPGPREAGVWLYGEALPKGLLSQEQGMAIMRVISIASATAVPDALIREIFEDARRFL